jgi:hypothetical protein
MTLSPPRNSASRVPSKVVALDYEIVQDQASALGRMGRALEAAVAALSAYDQSLTENLHAADPAARRALVQEASNALWCFVVQREACGLRDPRPVIRDYRVPAEVQNCMGAFGGQRQTAPAEQFDGPFARRRVRR